MTLTLWGKGPYFGGRVQPRLGASFGGRRQASAGREGSRVLREAEAEAEAEMEAEAAEEPEEAEEEEEEEEEEVSGTP